MSDTPRTDELIRDLATQSPEYRELGLIGFARILERELAEAQKQSSKGGENG